MSMRYVLCCPLPVSIFIFCFRAVVDRLSNQISGASYLIKYLVQFVGGVHNGHINIQKSGKRILCTQE